jgi:hypothetical protein
MGCVKILAKFFEKHKQKNILRRNNTNMHAYNVKFVSAAHGDRGRDWWDMLQFGASDECCTDSVYLSVRPNGTTRRTLDGF